MRHTRRVAPRRSPAPLLLTAAVVLALTPVRAPDALAHAEIRDADPRPGAEVASGIDELTLAFVALDPTGPVEVRVLDDADVDHAVGEPEVQARDSVVTVATDPLAPGTYRVRWSARSDDGDGPSSGGYDFDVVDDDGSGTVLWVVAALLVLVPAGVALGRRRRRTP